MAFRLSQRDQFFAKGFTLIELLVVVGIIALLVGIILARISTQQANATKVRIKTQLGQLATHMELYYATAGSYGNTYASAPCPNSSSPPDPIFYSDSQLKLMIGYIKKLGGQNFMSCAAGGSSSGNASSYAIAAPYKDSDLFTGPYWCVDSSGQRKTWTTKADGGFIDSIARTIIPTAYAGIVFPGPPLGGGVGTAAACP